MAYIEPPGNANLDKVGILSTSNEIGHLGFWGRQQDIVELAKTMDDPNTAIKTIQKGVETLEQFDVTTANPPDAVRQGAAYTRWEQANPTWTKGQPFGEGITNLVVITDRQGKPKFQAKKWSGVKPYQKFLNYPHLDGSTRSTAVAEFQNFFSSLSDYQQRVHDHVMSLPDGDPVKAHGVKVLGYISAAMNNVIEKRTADFWTKTINGAGGAQETPEDPDANNPNMSEEEKQRRQALRIKISKGMKKCFGDALATIPKQGIWDKWSIPDRQKTIDQAMEKHLFGSVAEAEELYDAFFSDINAIGIEHEDVISTVRDTGDRFHGHENHEPTTICD